MKSATASRMGFTLVEIMIVVAIIALLAVIAIPNYVRARTQSQLQACINNLRQINDACQTWAMEERRASDTAVSFSDIEFYLRGPVLCPASGSATTFAECYTLTTISNKPSCKIVPATHILSLDNASAGPVSTP